MHPTVLPVAFPSTRNDACTGGNQSSPAHGQYSTTESTWGGGYEYAVRHLADAGIATMFMIDDRVEEWESWKVTGVSGSKDSAPMHQLNTKASMRHILIWRSMRPFSGWAAPGPPLSVFCPERKMGCWDNGT